MAVMPPSLLDLVIPPRCLACGAVGTEALCGPCALRLTEDGEGYQLDDGIVTAAAYVYDHPLATAIKRVKTDALRAGARGLAELFAPHLPIRAPRTWVPAPARRRRRRGLDLAEILAGPAAVRLLVPTRDRPDQAELDAALRRQSVTGGYAVTGPVPPSVVVIDDVRATGATLRAAGRALVAGGARRVAALTLAASPGRPSAATRGDRPAAVQDATTTGGSARW